MKILVASHRRSGTHLTIDSISNNARLEFEISNFDKVRNSTGLETYGGKSVILKSHMNGNVFHKHEKDFLDNNIPVLYAYRDGRDVMQSLYNYEEKETDFPAFLEEKNFYDSDEYDGEMTRLEYWAFHVKSWLSKDFVIPVRFEDLRSSYTENINEIFNKSGLEIKKTNSIKDIRQTNKFLYYFRKYILKENLTTVAFNSGKTGSYSKYFNEELQSYYDKVLKEYELEEFFTYEK